ncbi:hypothetical protein SDC9_61501 [bioreactor metagenome]|uniref:Uncharacterized protein n=1 Tax=bioreactor metagenome TaxID=1076179 RepID=A0A644XFY3_9ZZZZ
MVPFFQIEVGDQRLQGLILGPIVYDNELKVGILLVKQAVGAFDDVCRLIVGRGDDGNRRKQALGEEHALVLRTPKPVLYSGPTIGDQQHGQVYEVDCDRIVDQQVVEAHHIQGQDFTKTQVDEVG